LLGGGQGSVTRPGRIYTNIPEEQFFRLHRHVLHELYHVIEQWGREGMTIGSYLRHARRREAEAEDFARENVDRYREILRLKE
jgi:hypothetical protein